MTAAHPPAASLTWRIFALRAAKGSAKAALRGFAARAGVELLIEERFPGYVVIGAPQAADLDFSTLREISPLGDLAAAAARGFGSGEAPSLPAWMAVGATARIAGGPMDGMSGPILSVDADRRLLRVGIDLFGRATPFEVRADDARRG
jgi:transcription antitermination factor NusG